MTCPPVERLYCESGKWKHAESLPWVGRPQFLQMLVAEKLLKGGQTMFPLSFRKRWLIVFNSFASLFTPQGSRVMMRKSEYAETDDKKPLLCFDSLSSVFGKHVSFWERAPGVCGSAFSPATPQVKPESWNANCHHVNCFILSGLNKIRWIRRIRFISWTLSVAGLC